MYLTLSFLVLCAVIQYLPMIIQPSLIFNRTVTLVFCMHVMHDTTYNTFIVGSLMVFSLEIHLNIYVGESR
jgi:hypothetical protein